MLYTDPRRFPFSGICAVFVLLWWVYLKYRTKDPPKGQQKHDLGLQDAPKIDLSLICD